MWSNENVSPVVQMCDACGFFGEIRKPALSATFPIETFIDPANTSGMLVLSAHLNGSFQQTCFQVWEDQAGLVLLLCRNAQRSRRREELLRARGQDPARRPAPQPRGVHADLRLPSASQGAAGVAHQRVRRRQTRGQKAGQADGGKTLNTRLERLDNIESKVTQMRLHS